MFIILYFCQILQKVTHWYFKCNILELLKNSNNSYPLIYSTSLVSLVLVIWKLIFFMFNGYNTQLESCKASVLACTVRHVVCRDEWIWSNTWDIISPLCLALNACVFAVCVHLPPEEIKHTAEHPSSCQSLPFISFSVSLFLSFSSTLSELAVSASLTMRPCLHLNLSFSSFFSLRYQSFFPFQRSLSSVSLPPSLITPLHPTSQFISPHRLSTHSLS